MNEEMTPENQKQELPRKQQNIIQSFASAPEPAKRAREEEPSDQNQGKNEAVSPCKRINEEAESIKQEDANINKTKQKSTNNNNNNNNNNYNAKTEAFKTQATPNKSKKSVKTEKIEKDEANKASMNNVKEENSQFIIVKDEDGDAIVPYNIGDIIVPEEPGKIIAHKAEPKCLYHGDGESIVSHDVSSITEIDSERDFDHDKDYIDHDNKDYIDHDNKDYIDHNKDIIDHDKDGNVLERDNSDSSDEDPLSTPSQMGTVLRSNSTHKKQMLMEHHNQLYECCECSFVSINQENLESHIFKQHGIREECDEPVSLGEIKNDLDECMSQQAPRKVMLEDGVILGRNVGNKVRLTCAVCNHISFSKYALMRHVQSHTREKAYSCDMCSYNTRLQEHMQRHMTYVHLIVHSDEHKLKYASKNRKKSEEKNVSTEDDKEEKDPDAESVNKNENKKEHKNENKNRNENEDEKNEANEEVSPDSSLNSADTTDTTSSGGKKRRNILRKRFECAACGMKATHKTDLVDHIREKHPVARIESLDNGDESKVQFDVTVSKKSKVSRRMNITCSYCSKVFIDSWKYKVHMRVHTGVKPFGCSVCSFYATSKMTVRDHIHRKHKNCENPKILLRTVNIDGTVGHVELSMPHQEFKCEFCEKVFEDNYHYKQHKKSGHQDVLPYSCNECGHREGVRGKIIIHCMQKHSDKELKGLILHYNKPFNVGSLKIHKCQQCDKVFPYQSFLNIHQRQHTGERKFFCDICSYRTNIKAALETHVRKKHLDGEPPKKSGRRRSTRNTVTECDQPIIFVDVDKVNNDFSIEQVKKEC